MLQNVLITKKSNLDIMLSFYDIYDNTIVISLEKNHSEFGVCEICISYWFANHFEVTMDKR